MGFGALIGTASGSGGIGSAVERAALEAANEGLLVTRQGRETAQKLTELGRHVFERDPRLSFAEDVQAVRAGLARQTGDELSPFAQLAFEDADRLLTERAVATGNLRSSNIQRGRAELLRRVIADELGRDFAFANLFGSQDLASRTLGLNLLDLGRGFLGVASGGVSATAAAGSVASQAEARRVADERLQGAAIGGIFDTLAGGFGAIGSGELPSIGEFGTNISEFFSLS